jgi:two-component system phosphate regulon response regulator PhoB
VVPTEPTAGRRVLIVEDDDSTRMLLHRILQVEGFEVRATATSREARDAVAELCPALVLLDLQLPDGDGLALLEDLRRDRPDLACIVVSGRDEEASRVLGLRLGADDYVVKPFSSGELLARVESVLRRTQHQPERASQIRHGELCIDLASREVRLAGDAVALTAKEYALLLFLASSPRQVFTRSQLLDRVWGSAPDWQDDATVTEHVRRLRRKLEPDPKRPLIETVRGVGYRFAGA